MSKLTPLYFSKQQPASNSAPFTSSKVKMKNQVNNATGELIKVSLPGLFSWKKKYVTEGKAPVYGSIIVALRGRLGESELQETVLYSLQLADLHCRLCN